MCQRSYLKTYVDTTCDTWTGFSCFRYAQITMSEIITTDSPRIEIKAI